MLSSSISSDEQSHESSGSVLRQKPKEIRKHKVFVLNACTRDGRELKYASKELKNDKEVVMAACAQNGKALRFASEYLRADKQVVMIAVRSKPESLQFALGGLNQDKDCLIKAGLWDVDHIDKKSLSNISGGRPSAPPKKIVLSTKFSLAAESSSHATKFTVDLKKHPYIANGNFVVYSPNAFNKGTCDPNWTDIHWPCRGTFDSCKKPPHLKRGIPREVESCWRYSFRYQLREAAQSGGFMIQVLDLSETRREYEMGKGQKIEVEMAEDVGIKVFRCFEIEPKGNDPREINGLISLVQKWYEGCRNMKKEETNLPAKGLPDPEQDFVRIRKLLMEW